jgi:hypothetical protein
MYSLFKRWFTKSTPDIEIKNYSVTTTPATEGTTSKYQLSPEMVAVVKKINSGLNINNLELNKLNDFYFHKPHIPPGVFSLNRDMVDRMVFEIKRIDTVADHNGDIVNILVTLHEITLNNEMSMSISVKDFHEIFQHFQFKPEKRVSK